MIIKQPQISLINSYTVEVHVYALNCKNHILILVDDIEVILVGEVP